ncbi:fatty acyl-CoA reductase [Aspergillus clavatus NRRL 1]|uniref:Fatty acyl-CoA reductase n=1 Tax=Aspergillus clavatus (strain ATCC 1007 / CBS 513.65 / DSM 816 / NCTC 3887 / NRRL 1 / QM 1276 / 107) TaxID=344612 RepID=A1CUN5_ASPCL|nr:NAD-binding domain 4 protein [Aspergillus clavatus NRRL 1]EAW07022.1 NAD-binding domain 4 protein [Aspergillus clavatus NRRL 1]
MSGPMASPPATEILRNGYARAFETHSVFLTGSTGSLGGCLLYKLALQLPTHRIFVLIRGSPQTAIEKWRKLMPGHVPAILDSGKVEFVVGDIKQADFGIKKAMLQRLREEVTLVIHAAAKITLDAGIAESIENNCLPTLELAQIISRFRRLKLFIQISTAYVNSFLPDGYVGERLYSISDEDPEDELAAIQATGKSPYTSRFSSSYTHAKYLMERLLLKNYPLLPLLLVRPTIFGSAFRDPYPRYGPLNSTPMNKFASLFFADLGSTHVWHAAKGYNSGANILDEIPVDFVANGCLLHAAAKTRGIVHLGAQLYVPHTFDDFLHLAASNAPTSIQKDLPTIEFTQDHDVPQSLLADLVKVATRNWLFDCGRSYWLKQVGGPLSFAACKHDVEQLNSTRVKEIYEKTAQKLARL